MSIPNGRSGPAQADPEQTVAPGFRLSTCGPSSGTSRRRNPPVARDPFRGGVGTAFQFAIRAVAEGPSCRPRSFEFAPILCFSRLPLASKR